MNELMASVSSGDDLTHRLLVSAPREHVRKAHIGWIAKLLARGQLLFEKKLPVVRGRSEDRRVLGPVGLDDDATGFVGTTRTAAHLLEQLERALGCAKVGKLERGVGIDDANERDIGKVETLRDHLGAKKNAAFARGKLPKKALVAPFALVVSASMRMMACHRERPGAVRPPRARYRHRTCAGTDCRIGGRLPAWVRYDRSGGQTSVAERS